MSDLEIYVHGDGEVQAIYSDDVADLVAGSEVRRASHVEPHPSKPGWLADMRPVGGPVLGDGWHRDPAMLEGELAAGIRDLPPFPTRKAALAAEVAWLRRRMESGVVHAAS